MTKEASSFEELWFSEKAESVRNKVRTCPKNCWMVGTAAPVMKKYISHPVKWVVKNKIKSLFGRPICTVTVPKCNVGQNPLQGDLRGGQVAASVTSNKSTGIISEMFEDERLKLIDEIEVENI